MPKGFSFYTKGDYIRLMVIVNTCQHKSTLVNGYRKKRRICSREGMKQGWKRGVVTGGIGESISRFCKAGNKLCRNEPYSR